MSCYECKNFSQFINPRVLKENGNEYTIFGQCFKQMKNTGYPVYVPNGSCKDIKKKSEKKELIGQLEMSLE